MSNPSSSHLITRRLGLKLLSGGLVASLGGAITGLSAPTVLAQQADKVRLGAPAGAVPGIKTAIAEGYFEREGIEIELVTLAGGPNILAATVGGSLEVGYSDLFAWVGALDNGFDLTFLQSANGRGNSDFIIASKDSGIASPGDLRGKKIGTAAHAQSKLRVTLYLERFGISPNEVEFVVINQRDTVGAALAGGQIHASIASDPNVAQWEKQYGVVILEGRPWEQVPERTTTAGFFSTSKWLSEDPDRAARFVRAAREGSATYNAYSAEQKAEISLKFDKVDLFAIEKEVPGVIKRMDDANASHSGPVDLDSTAQWLRIAADHGTIKKSIDLKPLLHSTALAPTI
jgi:taurine transport system substrate-binding protein